MVILHPDGLAVLKNDENDIFMELIKKVTSSPLAPNLLTSLRAVVNLFKNSGYHLWLQKHRVEIFDAFASCYSSPNKNVQVSYSTLVL
nr:phospholipase A2-activating protein [Tanacetum cinerariifolium]